jgi:sigma-B regulation protein RsbU (phosphoserine phosphatase)
MRERILVVDDDPGMLRTVRRILDRGYEVACASSADEAETLAAQHALDLAILDIRMPGRDGFELMSRLQATRPDLDVILMTGSLDEADEKLVRAVRQKAFYFIQKPFDREVLQTLVERCLELRRLGEENRQQLRRLENVLAEARAFQASLLPQPEARLGRVEIGARYVSCDQLCGDFYDYTACDGDTVAFLVADVSGHGASAAMLTGVVKSAFRSCHREGYEPRAVVERIFAGIQTFRANRFVTLFCGRLRAGEERLDFVNAGHPPAFLWHAKGDPEQLDPTGPLVSPVWDAPRWEQQTRPFRSGQRLLLYTDGLTEAPSGTEFFGVERVDQAIVRAPDGGAELADILLQDVENFMQGRRPVDDLTLLTVRLV